MKKGMLFLVLAFALMALQLANFASASELTDDYLDIANNYINSNNCNKALEYLDLILVIEPENLAAKALKEKILPTNNEPKNAEIVQVPQPEQKNVVIIQPTNQEPEKFIYNSDYYNKKGLELYEKKDFDSAIEYFYKSINRNKNNAKAYNNLAMSYWFKNNTSAAIKYLKKSSFIDKNYTQPLVNLAMLYKQLGDDESQLYYLQKAVNGNLNNYLAYYRLGDYYKNAGKYPEAIKNYKEVVKINQKFPEVYLSLAMSFFETEEFNYTLMALGQYKEFYPDSDFAFFLAARANLAMCRYSEAKADIERAIEINNNNEYQLELAKINYYLEDYTTALGIFQNLLKSGENAEIFNYIGLCHYKLKNIELAMTNFNKAIELDGLRPIYYYNLSQCYKSLGDKKNYVKYVNTATKITPINYQDFIDLSYIYYDNSNPSYSINLLNNAIAKYPSVKSLYLSKLKIYEAIGDNLHYNETKNLIEMRFNKK